jgi:hypothetical protein
VVGLDEEMATPPVVFDLAISLDPTMILAINAIHVIIRPVMQIFRVVEDLSKSGREASVVTSKASMRGMGFCGRWEREAIFVYETSEKST